MRINWKELPYNHKGRWTKKYDSIMTPGGKCTFPQLIAQWVLDTRDKYIKTFNIKRGPGWSIPIERQVRSLIQQASVLCNYFPHPDDDPLVLAAFRKYFTQNRIFKIGRYSKYRVTKQGKLNVTKDEKAVVKALMFTYNELKERASVKTVISEPIQMPKVTLKKQESSSVKRGKLAAFLEEEMKD